MKLKNLNNGVKFKTALQNKENGRRKAMAMKKGNEICVRNL